MHPLLQRRLVRIACGLLLGSLVASCNAPPPSSAPAAEAPEQPTSPALPLAHPPRHVFVIVLENEPFDVTFGAHSPAPYLAHQLPQQGALLRQYFAIGHYSLDNYLAMISGQGPSSDTQMDCHAYSDFVRSMPGVDGNGQVRGKGCVYPADVKTLANQLQDAGFSWKGYMEDMGNDPAREAAACAHPAIGAKDTTNRATATDQYADKHNPFAYFHAIIDDAAHCAAHVVNLRTLPDDLRTIATTPNFAFITPGLCDDGHNAPCKNGEPGGLISADKFLRTWVPRILASPAFQQDGALIITFDEGTDPTACCGETHATGMPEPGRNGPGGGRIGAVILSPFIAPGTVSKIAYNHYGLLRSIEDWFGLSHLGYAAQPSVRPFGADIFNRDAEDAPSKAKP